QEAANECGRSDGEACLGTLALIEDLRPIDPKQCNAAYENRYDENRERKSVCQERRNAPVQEHLSIAVNKP
ncbi:MAG TPA: hypothetical protein VE131_03410, partial [Terriglobales bacterium]|nr:hypothetical protein [Terriglobales bacterium]